MRARHLDRTLHSPRLRPASRMGGLAAFLLFACTLAGAASARSHSPASAAQQTPENSRTQSANPKPAAAQAPAAAPMVLGQNPDDAQDGANTAPAPATPRAASTAPAAAAPVAAPVNAAMNPSPAAAADAPLPVPPPANAGGNQARQEINDDCVSLLKMANSLKASVDKSTKDELSLAVVRQADQIEHLARQMKDEMKPAIGQK